MAWNNCFVGASFDGNCEMSWPLHSHRMLRIFIILAFQVIIPHEPDLMENYEDFMGVPQSTWTKWKHIKIK